ncbi:MAG TPA: LON peptidase substrate-binding domain-containing protein, partial [Armatimonadota bacterium]|nr:LON peptidase substrate-binding domain-containing protein [Armatimonadota bacterium]
MDVNVKKQEIGDVGEDKQQKDEMLERQLSIPDTLALLPLNDSVLLPSVVMPLLVARESSVRLVDDAVVSDTRIIGVVAKRDITIENPQITDLYDIATAAVIHTMIRLPDGQRLIVQGLQRIRITDVIQTEPYFKVRVEEVPDIVDWTPEQEIEIEALRRNIADTFRRVVSLSPTLPDEL